MPKISYLAQNELEKSQIRFFKIYYKGACFKGLIINFQICLHLHLLSFATHMTMCWIWIVFSPVLPLEIYIRIFINCLEQLVSLLTLSTFVFPLVLFRVLEHSLWCSPIVAMHLLWGISLVFFTSYNGLVSLVYHSNPSLQDH